MAVLFAAQSLLHCLAVFGSALADCAKVSSPTNATHAAAVKVGLITHSPGNIPLDACDFEAPRGAKLPRWPTAGRNEPDRQHGYVPSLFLPCQEQKENPRKEKGGARKRRPSLLRPTLAQCAVSVEESASTAGSVLTEVSVGLAFSSSHSIGSGLPPSARAKNSSLAEAGPL